MNLIKTSAILLAFFLVACGGAEKNTTNSSTSVAEAVKETASEGANKLEKLKDGVAETAKTMTEEGEKIATATKEKIAANAPTIAEAITAPVNKVAKDAVNISVDDAKSKGKEIVKTTKEKAQTATNAVAQKTENMVVKGAEKVTEATKSAVPKTTPKIVEAKKEAVVEKAATTTTVATTPAPAVKEKVAEKKTSTVDHSTWDQLLRKHVTSSGKVNYKAIKADQSNLDVYLKTLSDNPINKEWSRNEKMAYWINAYNAYTVKLIVDNYPVKSILDLHGGKAWDHSWIKLGDKTYTLNDIEHKILRPQFKDPRIHFAVNCAATSCPPLFNRAWTAGNLNKTLELQTKKFVNNSGYNSIGSEVAVSKIFEWYKEDFGELSAYLNKYTSTPIPAGTSINFKEYDWALNKQ